MTVKPRGNPARELSVVRQLACAVGIGMVGYVLIAVGLSALRPGPFQPAVLAFGLSLRRAGGLLLAAMLLLELSCIAYDVIGWQRYSTGRTAHLRQLLVYGGEGGGPPDRPIGPRGKALLYLLFTVSISSLAYAEAFAEG